MYSEVKQTAGQVSEKLGTVEAEGEDGNKSVLSERPLPSPRSYHQGCRIQDKARNVGFDWEERVNRYGIK